jgi:hypothetical protein
MRRLTAVAALVGTAGLISCKRHERIRLEPTEETVPQLASVVHTADPQSALQLVKGFHEVEENSWRWTMGKFAVTLKPPPGSAARGATLRFKFTIPEAVIQGVGPMSLTARAERIPLGAEKFEKPGEHAYIREIPPALLQGEAVTLDFALDKVLAPTAKDGRELGVIAAIIGLEAK